MSTDAAEKRRELAIITEQLLSGGYDGTEDEGDTTWTDFGIVCGIAEFALDRLAAAEARAEDAQQQANAWADAFRAAEAQRDTLVNALKDAEMTLQALLDSSVLESALKHTRAALAAVTPTEGPPSGYIVPSGDERCGFVMDACQCMKRKGHEGLHGCAHGGWRAAEERPE